MEIFPCEYCGKPVKVSPSQMNQHHFCSRVCLGKAVSEGILKKDTTKTSEHMRKLNAERRGPSRSERKTGEARNSMVWREKLRNHRINTGSGGCYEKWYGRHRHRVVAEQILGRPLAPGEVVHHVNGDKRDNRPENLMVFASQAEHARWHCLHDPTSVAKRQRQRKGVV